MTEVEVIGYKVERNTVPLATIQALVVQIERGLEVSLVRDKWNEFKTPVEAIAVRDEFMKTSSSKVAGFFAPRSVPATPSSITVCMFHSAKVDTSVPKSGRKDNALVIIALTKLDSTSGWFELLEGSHQKSPEHKSVDDLKRADFVLEPGDAVIWRGDLSYYRTSGGGGKFEILVYDIQG